MRLVAALLACAALSALSACVSAQDFLPCTSTTPTTIPVYGTNVTFGCNGYSNNVNYNFTIQYAGSIMFIYNFINTEACCDSVSVYKGTTLLGQYKGQPIVQPLLLTADFPGEVYVLFYSDQSNTDPGFSITVEPQPPSTPLLSGHNVTSEVSLSEGGWVYYRATGLTSGGSFVASLVVSEYSGLQSPAIFIAVNRFPTLESYDFYAQSNQDANGDYIATISKNGSVANGDYYVGVFLYGQSAVINVFWQWTYDPSICPFLASGQIFKGSLTANAVVCFQAALEDPNGSIIVEFSRQIPGGYPVLLGDQGVMPSTANPSSNTVYLLTDQNSYWKQTYSPSSPSTSPNPGLWVFNLLASSNSGYIIRLTF